MKSFFLAKRGQVLKHKTGTGGLGLVGAAWRGRAEQREVLAPQNV